MLLSGVMMTGTGATLAVTGISGQEDAAVSQYVAPEDAGATLGDREASSGEDEGSSAENLSGTGSGDPSDPRASEQASAAGGGGSLPFTGLVVLPLLVGGMVLTAVGGFLRLRVRRDVSV